MERVKKKDADLGQFLHLKKETASAERESRTHRGFGLGFQRLDSQDMGSGEGPCYNAKKKRIQGISPGGGSWSKTKE